MTENKDINNLSNNNNDDERPKNEIPEKILKEIPEKVAKFVVATVEKRFSGPLPPPEILAAYKNILPDAPERIFSMAEKQQHHQVALEEIITKSDIKRADRGLIFGFILFLILIGGAIYLFAMEKNIGGYIFIFSSIAAAIVTFVRVGRERNRGNNKDFQQ